MQGIYRGTSFDQDRTSQCFRFYDDGLLLDVLIRLSTEEQFPSGTQIAQWLDREKATKGIVRSTYLQRGKEISFSTPGHFGDGVSTVDYSGSLQSGLLVLSCIDHNTGRRESNMKYSRIYLA